LLHQRDTSVTKYYSQPTGTQVMEAAEMVFVDRVLPVSLRDSTRV